MRYRLRECPRPRQLSRFIVISKRAHTVPSAEFVGLAMGKPEFGQSETRVLEGASASHGVGATGSVLK
ncbi:unnamed protein product, partial [Nesidiocoris tenuis]